MKYIFLILTILPFLGHSQDRKLRTDSTYAKDEIIDGKKYFRIINKTESEPIDSATYVRNSFNYFIDRWNAEKQASRVLYELLTTTPESRQRGTELQALSGKSEYDLAYDEYKNKYLNSLWNIRDNVNNTSFLAVLVQHPNQQVGANLLMFRECTVQRQPDNQFTYTLVPQGQRYSVVLRTDEAFEILLAQGVRPNVFLQYEALPTEAGVTRQVWADHENKFSGVRIGLTFKESE